MKYARPLLAILLATLWIGLSEFVRNQVLLVSFWTNHYQSLGLVFPAKPVNGAMWGAWSLLYAIAVFFIARKFNLLEAFLLSWFIGFVMMWVAIGNLGVLPFGILPMAIPLSLLEAFLAVYIIKRIT